MLRSYGCDAEFVVNIWVRPGHAAFLAAALLAILPTGPVDAVYLKNKHGEVFVDSLMISKHSEKVKHEVDFHSPRPVVAVKDDISKKTLLDVVDFVEDMALYEEEAIGDAGLNWAHRQIVNDRMVCDLLAAAHVLEMDSLAAAVMTMKPTWEEVSALEERVSTNEYLLAIRNCQPMVQLLGYADTAEQKAIAEAVPTAIVFAATDPVNKVHNGKWQGDANVLQWATAQSKTEIQEMLLSVPSEDVQQEEYWTRHGGRSSRRSQPACACRIM
ncbi:SKP1 component POZ domain-containing protein [Plasmodiophora brassicae]